MNLSERLQELAGLARSEAVPRSDLHHELQKLARRQALEDSPFVTIAQAARRWSMCPKELRRRIRAGEIPTKMIATRVRVLSRLIQGQKHQMRVLQPERTRI